MTHVDWKLAADPDQLGGVRLKLLDAADVRLADMDSIGSQGINGVEIRAKHVRVLVILGVDVLTNGGGERQMHRPSKRQRENAASSADVSGGSAVRGQFLLTWSPWRSKSPSREAVDAFLAIVVLRSTACELAAAPVMTFGGVATGGVTARGSGVDLASDSRYWRHLGMVENVCEYENNSVSVLSTGTQFRDFSRI